MDNKVALMLAILVVAVIVADRFYFGWDLHLFLATKLVALTDSLAFWR